MADRTFYLTTPIYYVNARPHLGHAYTTIMADAMCRYRRLRGDRVYFLTGTDEHGDRIAQAAAAAGVTPQAYADEISGAFRETWRQLGITNDDFIRTTEPRHTKVVQADPPEALRRGRDLLRRVRRLVLLRLRALLHREGDRGRQVPGPPDGAHLHQGEELLLQDVEVPGVADQAPRGQPGLHPARALPERGAGLPARAAPGPLDQPARRRGSQWGIPLPFDDQYVTYVWFDALINYVSALGYPDGALYKELWPHVEHLIGKDILKPHGVYWPTMLHAAGIPLYRRLNVHGYWSLGGGKMSKSVGNVVEAFQLTDKYGHDAFRYFLLREMNFGLDASFSEEALVGRLNADLANDLGNLASRATTLIVEVRRPSRRPAGQPTAEDQQIRALAAQTAQRRRRARWRISPSRRRSPAIWEFIGALNRYVDTAAPWELAKDPAKRPRLERVLCTLADVASAPRHHPRSVPA